MPVSPPPDIALKEILGATTRHVRRVEIYEADGVTRWAKDKVGRLKGGSVNVDSTRDERRILDLTLSNSDGVLVSAAGEFWYDKIIKVFRGVEVNEPIRIPKILVLSDKTGEQTLAQNFRQSLVTIGFGDIRINTLASNYAIDIQPYDIIVALGSATTAQINLLNQAYTSGKSVLVVDADANAWITSQFPTSTRITSTSTLVAANPVSTNPASKAWQSFSHGAGTAYSYAIPSSEAFMISLDANNNSYSKASAYSSATLGGRAVALTFPVVYTMFDIPQFRNMITSALNWLNTVKPMKVWEVQIGEFMIDRISEPNFPYEVKITGRDYTKKCLKSKYAQATQFDAGYSLESLIATIAGAAGISKRSLPATGITVGRTFFFDRGVDRWSAMKEIANAYNYELYFDATGYLTMRLFRDPATEAPAVYIHTGKDGVVATYEKSSSDSRLYNSVVVTGESSDASIPPVWAVAKNQDPNSPTSIQRMHAEILYQYSSSFITTTAQAQAVANSFLAVHALEEFELSFDSLLLPWLEGGDVMGWVDPNPAPGDPSSFILSSINLPLDLAPMSSTAKRVTIVG